MWAAKELFPLLALVAQVLGEGLDANINYGSPSRRHSGLGLDIPQIQRRFVKRDDKAYDPKELNFTHGVASGDPYPNSVILWTRVAPSLKSDTSDVVVTGNVPYYSHDTETYIKASKNPICVEYKVYSDKEARKVADKGTAYTTSDIDFTLKVEAKNLKPFSTYWYQFNVCGTDIRSPLGRTKTSPNANDNGKDISLAVFSCANFSNGYFNAYGNVARKDNVDYVVHLGDYIYEIGRGELGKDERATDPPHDIFTLYDYRTRIGQHRLDLDLRATHEKFAWIPVWDDHEVANNAYRDGMSALNNTEESFLNDGPGISVDQRKVNAVRAYFEWMPIRQVEMDDNLRIWRSFQLGKTLDLIMLDTRNYDRSIVDLGWNDNYIQLLKGHAARTLMGSRQENWFYNQLSQSQKRGATWRVIGNQILFSRNQRIVKGKPTIATGNWNGYTANRDRVYKHLYDNNIGNNIMLAGDSHKNWVSDLAWVEQRPYDSATGEGAVGVEFAGTAVTSNPGGFGDTIASAESMATEFGTNNAELQWVEGYYRGYYELHVSPKQVQAKFYGSPSVATRNAWEIPLANFTVKAGANRLSRPLADGRVESGFLKDGAVTHSNLTLNTETGEWKVIGFEKRFI
ncbi:alkaline phosphatase-like protein [Eremomyces bilateralis CBS 781.70]|uniref:Alkaline phosphatase-like protein n=1 Tax=Eremomyces bilateralis CBS 781.70 TaxID=1392243 RepID=A0A6G1FQN6_9PEZI|nr:alkaline phosphatase-like protein [Eremomyces bilateralis CBS 781.70]KAF1808107.1 alkaline phosphatase-like protein [Eremomyces bilateralis CBS 781.70]